jgi:hypothetical protein
MGRRIVMKSYQTADAIALFGYSTHTPQLNSKVPPNFESPYAETQNGRGGYSLLIVNVPNL